MTRKQVARSQVGLLLGQAGFSLPEMISAFAISMILVLMFSTFISNVAKSSLWMETMNDVVQTANFATLQVGKLLQVSGGGPLRPWHAIKVENNCGPSDVLPGCDESDRITIAQIGRDGSGSAFPTCTLSGAGYDPATGHVSVDNSSGCCLQPIFANQGMAMLSGSATVRYRYITKVDMNACTLETEDFRQAQLLTNAPADEEFLNGTMVVVGVSTYYLDQQNHTLMSYSSSDNNTVINEGEAKVVERDIFDFQISLGYDVGPSRDGLFWNRENATDEWLYNATDDIWGKQGLANALDSDLRMIYVGLTAGSQDNRRNATSSHAGIFDGPARQVPGWTLFNVTRKVSLRNNLVFY